MSEESSPIGTCYDKLLECPVHCPWAPQHSRLAYRSQQDLSASLSRDRISEMSSRHVCCSPWVRNQSLEGWGTSATRWASLGPCSEACPCRQGGARRWAGAPESSVASRQVVQLRPGLTSSGNQTLRGTLAPRAEQNSGTICFAPQTLQSGLGLAGIARLCCTGHGLCGSEPGALRHQQLAFTWEGAGGRREGERRGGRSKRRQTLRCARTSPALPIALGSLPFVGGALGKKASRWTSPVPPFSLKFHVFPPVLLGPVTEWGQGPLDLGRPMSFLGPPRCPPRELSTGLARSCCISSLY